MIFDPLFLAKLNVIKNYEVRQGNVLLEAVTAGIWPNTYIIGDRDRPVMVREGCVVCDVMRCVVL